MASSAVSLTPRNGVWVRSGLAWGWLRCGRGHRLAFYSQAVFTYLHFDAAHCGNFWRARFWPVAHFGGGSLALLIGPFQFVPALRRRYSKAHRWMGRLYLAGVLVGSLASIYIHLHGFARGTEGLRHCTALPVSRVDGRLR